MAAHDPNDPNGLHRRASDLYLQSIEGRLDALSHQLRELHEWRLGVTVMIDAIPHIQSAVEQQERADAIEAGVAEGLRKAEVRGWGRTERSLAMLGGAGIVASLVLNLIQTIHGF